MKKFTHLLAARGAPRGQEEPLHSRAGKYIKLLEASSSFKAYP
jgi:hypothetical protein